MCCFAEHNYADQRVVPGIIAINNSKLCTSIYCVDGNSRLPGESYSPEAVNPRTICTSTVFTLQQHTLPSAFSETHMPVSRLPPLACDFAVCAGCPSNNVNGQLLHEPRPPAAGPC